MTRKQPIQLVPLDHNDPDQVGCMFKVRRHPEVAQHFFAKPPNNYLNHVQFLVKSQESGERQFFIIQVNDQMAGYCQIIHHTDSLEVGLALHPMWWNKGIGGASMQVLLDSIRISQCKTITLIVKKDNGRAVHLYEKLGFVAIKEDAEQLTMKYTH